MTSKLKSILLPVVFAIMILGFSAAFFIKGETEYSDSERRLLKKFPELSAQTISDGSFMDELEEYTLDQFPLRDSMRSIKALSEYYVFGNPECNDFYLQGGHIAKIEYPRNDAMLDNAAEKFDFLIEKYLADKNCNIYFSIIPDKGAFLADEAGVLKIDYEKFVSDMRSRTPDMKYIDVFEYLSADDYYTTDPHWRQEKIVDIANAVSSAMGRPLSDSYVENELENPFYGAYYGQAAVPAKPEKLIYLTNETIDSCIVTSYDSGAAVASSMYDMEKAVGRDPYEMFLSGSQAIMTIENPNAESEKQLVIFRDSFGSSITPLLVESYNKITLVDIRYINSAFVGNFVDFDSCDDVLFLYSNMILNNSTSFK